MEKLDFKDKNLDEDIKKIFNESYEDFVAMYGTKYQEYIKNMIEKISGNVRKKEMYEGGLALANADKGVIYGKSERLSPILKHELMHVYNESSFGTETSYAKLPDNYIKVLDENGMLRKEYKEAIQKYKEKWKDEPLRLKYLLVDYDTFVERFDLGESEIEKLTEWFNSRTNVRDMREHFVDLGDGFYMGGKSSHSFYDYYTNICDMVSAVIPIEKLVDMHVNT